MAATLNLLVPNKLQNNDPCCCITNDVQLFKYAIPVTFTGSDFRSSGVIILDNVAYNYDIIIRQSGDNLTGNVKMTRARNNRAIDNELPPQRTAYPSTPFYHEWNGLKAYGLGSYFSIEFADTPATIVTPPDPVSGGLNSAVTATWTAELFESNMLHGRDQLPVQLSGTDATDWQMSGKLELNPVLSRPGLNAIVYKTVIDSLSVAVKVGSVQSYGQLRISITPEFAPSKNLNSDFKTGDTISSYNTAFPWTNIWTIVDSAEPSMALLKYNATDLLLPDNFRYILTLGVTGSSS